MIYTCSDLHGYPLDAFLKMLEKINFSQDDHLYILGDVVDRGEHAAELIQWIMKQKNVTLLKGNHELMMLSCGFLFKEITDESIDSITDSDIECYGNWMANGGSTTLAAMKKLSGPQRTEIVEFIKKCPLYEDITVGGKRFVLTHSGPGNFREDRNLISYLPRELVWTRPSLDTKFYSDGTMCIFGHTPTLYYGSAYTDKAIFTETWINVDVGAGYGHTPMILRLDDLKPFYF